MGKRGGYRTHHPVILHWVLNSCFSPSVPSQLGDHAADVREIAPGWIPSCRRRASRLLADCGLSLHREPTLVIMSAGMGLGAVPVGPSHGPAADCSLSAWNAPTLPLDTMPCGDSYDPTLLPNGNPNSTNCTYAAPGGRAVCSGGFCVCTANFGGTTGPGNSTTGCSCSMAEMLGDVWQPLMLGLCALHAALAAAAVYMLLVRLRRAFERHRSRRRRCCAVFSECCRWDRWSPTTLGHKDITSTLVVSSLAIRSVYFYRLSGAVVDERLMLPMQVTGLPMSSSDLLAAIASMVLVNDVVELAHDLSPSLSGRRCQRQLMRGIFGLTYFGMPLAAVGVETLVKDTYSRFRYYETVQICSFALGVLVTIVYFIQSRASLRRFSNMSSLALRMEAAIAYISSLTFFVTVVGFLAVAGTSSCF